MSRRLRPYLPGAAFHLTARTQGRLPWLTPPVRTWIVGRMVRAFRRTDARLLAYAIMPNHLHLVVRQGNEPLGRLMQPLLTAVARQVQRVHGVEGHVLERRYADRPCLDPDYLRNAIVYTHLNPVRAGLCDEPDAYAWTSHSCYSGLTGSGDSPAVDRLILGGDGRGLFAGRPGRAGSRQCEDYVAFLAWRREKDAWTVAATAGFPCAMPPDCPSTEGGDVHWASVFGSTNAAAPPARGPTPAPPRNGPRPDLSEIARRVLVERGARISLDELRGGYGGRARTEIRSAMIRRMSAAGYSGAQIAGFLRVSRGRVSQVLWRCTSVG